MGLGFRASPFGVPRPQTQTVSPRSKAFIAIKGMLRKHLHYLKTCFAAPAKLKHSVLFVGPCGRLVGHACVHVCMKLVLCM